MTVMFAAPSGPIQGWRDGPVTRATGIPYASSARFAAPVATGDRTAVFDASSWSPSCPQRPVPLRDRALGGSTANLAAGENSQHLSVTVPAHTRPDDELPVMVWIHGGSSNRWRTGTAQLVPDDDVAERARTFAPHAALAPVTALAFRLLQSDPVTVRIAFDA